MRYRKWNRDFTQQRLEEKWSPNKWIASKSNDMHPYHLHSVHLIARMWLSTSSGFFTVIFVETICIYAYILFQASVLFRDEAYFVKEGFSILTTNCLGDFKPTCDTYSGCIDTFYGKHIGQHCKGTPCRAIPVLRDRLKDADYLIWLEQVLPELF